MIEAMACGTPVVATRQGAAPELVTHDMTGFLAGTVDALAKAVDAAGQLNRQRCRGSVARRFSMDRMASDHETFYHQVINARHARQAGGLLPGAVVV
jgi:glycosyltransferase involved in cell wall biosynthesis